MLALVVTACGVSPGAAYATGGAAAAAGANGTYQLGERFMGPQEKSPIGVVGLNTITEVAAGYHFTVTLMADGTVRAWGGNDSSQVGDGTRSAKYLPTTVPGLESVTKIASDGVHSMALLSNGKVMTWGTNQAGQDGNGTGGIGTTLEEPTVVESLSSVVDIAVGGASDYALLSNGKVMAWGGNKNKQLGIVETEPEECKTEAGWVKCSKIPREVTGLSSVTVTAIAGGGESGYALLSTGHVMAWGNNGKGQLGTEGATTNVPAEVVGLTNAVEVSGGEAHALARLSTGKVVGWGQNSSGDLGGTSTEECQSVPCNKTPKPITGVENVTRVSAGRGYSLALSEGKVYAFGNNEFGQLGTGSSAESSNVPTAITGLSTITGMAAGEQHTVLLLETSTELTPVMSITPESKALTLAWTFVAPEYKVRYTLEGKHEFSATVTLGEGIHSQPFTSLSVAPYEVVLKKEGESRTIIGTPLP